MRDSANPDITQRKSAFRRKTANASMEVALSPMPKLLKAVLSDVIDLQTQLTFGHWNAGGPRPWKVQRMTEAFSEELQEDTEALCDRVMALCDRATGISAVAVESSKMPEYVCVPKTEKGHLLALVGSYAFVAKQAESAVDAAIHSKDHLSAGLLISLSCRLNEHLSYLKDAAQTN